MTAEHDGLIARIRQVRRLAIARDRVESPPDEAPPERVRGLETRVAALEQLVQGLQDSVHRESERHAKLIGELQDQIRPESMSAALAKDARERGL